METTKPDLITGAFERMMNTSREMITKWNDWFQTQPQSSACELHNEVLPVNVDESHRESWRGKEFVVVYAVCPKCRAEEVVRGRSAELVKHGVPEILAHANFENFICHTDEDKINLSTAREFVSNGRGFLVLLGSVGNGKSHLAVATARAMACNFRFITQGGLLKKLRDSYRNDRVEDIVESCKRVRLFVLDEIGMSGGGKDEQPMLHEILSERHNSRKPTVLTSNLTRTELDETLGERMADRLTQSGYKLLNFTGPSNRRSMRKNY